MDPFSQVAPSTKRSWERTALTLRCDTSLRRKRRNGGSLRLRLRLVSHARVYTNQPLYRLVLVPSPLPPECGREGITNGRVLPARRSAQGAPLKLTHTW